MSRIAIHQPNYAPWLGYFRKIALAEQFVFLDDAQYSKGSYINRVRVRSGDGEPRWLTQPVSARLGAAISAVALARPDWARAHLDTLRTLYGGAAAFARVWPDITALYRELPAADLAAVNRTLIESLCARLGVGATFRRSADIDVGEARGDDRLIAIARHLAPGGTYLSGTGGAGYQDPAKFARAGIALVYSDFVHPRYDQGGAAFVAGLSVLDAIFHLGFEGAGMLVRT